MKVSFDPETDLKIEKFMRAQPETIWRCWEEPDLFKQWFTPQPVEVTEVENVLEPGGRSFVTMKLPDGTIMPLEGCFVLVERPKLLVYGDAMTAGFRPAPSPFITAIVETIAKDGGTIYRATVLHPDATSREKHEEMGFFEGWGTTFDQLARLVETL